MIAARISARPKKVNAFGQAAHRWGHQKGGHEPCRDQPGKEDRGGLDPTSTRPVFRPGQAFIAGWRA
jgi:hypothetical protein